MKREGELKSLFGKELKRQLPGFLTLAYLTNGAPDRSIVGAAKQSNWEMKHATPDFKSPGDQELMCCRLAVAAHCRYVIWEEKNGILRTLIVHPQHVIRKGAPSIAHSSVGLIAEVWCIGFDMNWLVKHVRKVHYGV